jgi:hypothetical protein
VVELSKILVTSAVIAMEKNIIIKVHNPIDASVSSK